LNRQRQETQIIFGKDEGEKQAKAFNAEVAKEKRRGRRGKQATAKANANADSLRE
jgi:hypothetical protein